MRRWNGCTPLFRGGPLDREGESGKELNNAGYILNVISFRIYLIPFVYTKVLIIVRIFSTFSI